LIKKIHYRCKGTQSKNWISSRRNPNKGKESKLKISRINEIHREKRTGSCRIFKQQQPSIPNSWVGYIDYVKINMRKYAAYSPREEDDSSSKT